MDANYHMARFVLFLTFASFPLCSCASAERSQNYEDELQACITTVHDALAPIAKRAPRFEHFHEASQWISENMPSPLKSRYSAAGKTVREKITEWTASEAIDSTFWNTQLADELLYAQYFVFDGMKECSFQHATEGVVGEIVEDQLYVAFVMNTPLESVANAAGFSDPGEVKRALMYAIFLDGANLEWTESELGRTVKYPGILNLRDK